MFVWTLLSLMGVSYEVQKPQKKEIVSNPAPTGSRPLYSAEGRNTNYSQPTRSPMGHVPVDDSTPLPSSQPTP